MVRAVLVLFLLFLVKACQSVLIKDVYAWRLQLCAVLTQALGPHAFSVERDHLKRAVCRDCNRIGGKYLVGGVGYLSGQNVCLEKVICVVQRLKRDVACREVLLYLYVCVNLVVEAAFQFGTLSCKLLRVH